MIALEETLIRKLFYKPIVYIRMKRRKSTGRRVMRGGGFFGDLWDGIKSAGSAINDVAKKTKLVSTIASATGNPEVGAIASQLGYGKGKFRVPRKGVILA
jgi:hypothetical protein